MVQEAVEARAVEEVEAEARAVEAAEARVEEADEAEEQVPAQEPAAGWGRRILASVRLAGPKPPMSEGFPAFR